MAEGGRSSNRLLNGSPLSTPPASTPNAFVRITPASEYYPDDEDAEDEPGLLGRMLDRLLPAAPERHPADAGEEMLRHIALLRTALTNVRDGNVLLIHLH